MQLARAASASAALPGALARLAHEPPVGAAGVEQRAPGLDLGGRRPWTCDSRGDARRDVAGPVRQPDAAVSTTRVPARADRGRARAAAVTVCLPRASARPRSARSSAALLRAARAGVIDEIVVVDAASADGTARGRGAAGARGAPGGRAAAVVRARCWARATRCGARCRRLRRRPGRASSTPTREALLARTSRPGCSGRWCASRACSFVKGFYRRPFERAGRGAAGEGGGRVNHLMARPALRAVLPGARGGPPAAGGRGRGAPRAARARCRSRPATASRSRC